MIGKLLALPFKVLNAPVRGAEKILGKMCGQDDIYPQDRLLSAPLKALSDALEEIDE